MILTGFLLARIAEDETVATESVDGDTSEWLTDEKLTGDCDLHPDTSAHIIRWSPARILAECETKRHIIAIAEASWDAGGGYDQEAVDARAVLHALAQVYADHKDFQEEWRV